MVKSILSTNKTIIEACFIIVLTFVVLFSVNIFLDNDSAIAGEAYAFKTAPASTISKNANQAGNPGTPELEIVDYDVKFLRATAEQKSLTYYSYLFDKKTGTESYTEILSETLTYYSIDYEEKLTIKNIGTGTTSGTDIIVDRRHVVKKSSSDSGEYFVDDEIEDSTALGSGQSQTYSFSSYSEHKDDLFSKLVEVAGENKFIVQFNSKIYLGVSMPGYPTIQDSTVETLYSSDIIYSELQKEYVLPDNARSYSLYNSGSSATASFGTYEINLVGVSDYYEAEFSINGASIILRPGEFAVLDDGSTTILVVDSSFQDYAGGVDGSEILVASSIWEK